MVPMELMQTVFYGIIACIRRTNPVVPMQGAVTPEPPVAS